MVVLPAFVYMNHIPIELFVYVRRWSLILCNWSHG